MTRTAGYVTVLRGDLADALADEPTKRRHVLSAEPPRRWAPPDPELLGRILEGLDRV